MSDLGRIYQQTKSVLKNTNHTQEQALTALYRYNEAVDNTILGLHMIVDALPKDAEGITVVEGGLYHVAYVAPGGNVCVDSGKAMMQWESDDGDPRFAQAYRTKDAAERSLTKENDNGK